MSFVERAKALREKRDMEYVGEMVWLRDCLPELIAVVEAAEDAIVSIDTRELRENLLDVLGALNAKADSGREG